MSFKKGAIAGMLFFFAGSMYAGPVEKGIEFNEAKMYEAAKAYLLQGIQTEASAEALYYLGDTYIMLNKEDSAAYYFKKSLEKDPDYTLALVGEGKLSLKKKNIAEASEIFNQATKKDKKNPAVYTAIAAAYVDFDQFDKATPMYEKAKDVKKNYPDAFIVEGDMLLKKDKAGDACRIYANAAYFDPKNKIAYLREAQVYKNINTDRSLEILDNLTTTVDPDYIPAYVEYADIYYSKGYFKKAIPVYEKIINEPGINTKDIEKYATVLYFSQEYLKSLEQINSVLKKDPNNFIMRRLEFYNNIDLGNDQEALALGEKFFTSKGEKDEYIEQDYSSYAKLLTKNKQDAAAIPFYEKALKIDSTKVEFYKEISSAYEKTEKYDEAIASYQKYMDLLEKPNPSDYYNFGRSYYNAGTQKGIQGDTVAQKAYLNKADSLFTEVTVLNPDSYLGFIYKARTLSSLDPEFTLGLAKPAYEQTLEKVLAVNEDGKRGRELTECYMYLANYYYLNKDKTKALEYFNKALELNPNNEQLKKAIKEL